MNITFTMELSTSKGFNDEQSVLIRCTQNRKHKRISTGISVQNKYWDKTLHKIKKAHPLSDEYNKLILEKLRKITTVYTKLVEENEEVTLDDLSRTSNRETSTNFYEFAYRTKMAEIKSRDKLGTYRRYEAVLNKFKVFTKANLTISQINYDLIRRYELYLVNELKNSRDTVSSNLSVIRTIINEAIKNELFRKSNPFDQIPLKYTDNTKEKLTAAELFKIMNAPLPKIPSLLLARDFFLACFLAEGTRGGDMMVMQKENIINNCLVYHQQKTGKQMVIPIVPLLMDIINRQTDAGTFIFPLMTNVRDVNEITINSKLTYINKYLRELCKYCGIFKKISTHCARHTYTDLALQVSNGNIYQVQQSLGHSSVKTTEIYSRRRVNYQRPSLLLDILTYISTNTIGTTK